MVISDRISNFKFQSRTMLQFTFRAPASPISYLKQGRGEISETCGFADAKKCLRCELNPKSRERQKHAIYLTTFYCYLEAEYDFNNSGRTEANSKKKQ